MPKASAPKTSGKAIGVKYPLDIESRIHAISSELARRAAGLPQPSTNVMLMITTRGLDVVESELGIVKAKPTKSTKAA